MTDTYIIPKKEALLALDLVSASQSIHLSPSVALSNSDSILRLQSLYTFHGIDNQFSRLVLSSLLNEGQRQMMMNQPIHTRIQSTIPPDTSHLLHPTFIPTEGK